MSDGSVMMAASLIEMTIDWMIYKRIIRARTDHRLCTQNQVGNVMTDSASLPHQNHSDAEQLRRSLNLCEAQLAQSQQEMSGLLYAISHDLRAPLRALTGFSQALQDHLINSADETAKQYLQRLNQSSQRMTAMIDAMLSLSRITQAEMLQMDVDLSVLSREAIAEITARNPSHQPRVSIRSPLPVHGDPRLLKQLMTKLLENAWKCTTGKRDAHIEVGSIEEAEQVIYFVRDNGIGFDMSLANKLFIPFQQLHGGEELRGQGLGLAIAQRIIARHGGKIWAQAEPHHGAQFFINLPS
jgi:signal transduction histidine kinase